MFLMPKNLCRPSGAPKSCPSALERPRAEALGYPRSPLRGCYPGLFGSPLPGLAIQDFWDRFSTRHSFVELDCGTQEKGGFHGDRATITRLRRQSRYRELFPGSGWRMGCQGPRPTGRLVRGGRPEVALAGGPRPVPHPRLGDDAGADDGGGGGPLLRPVPRAVPDRGATSPRPTRPTSSRPGRAWATTGGPASSRPRPGRSCTTTAGSSPRTPRRSGPCRASAATLPGRSSRSPSTSPRRSSRPTPSASWRAGSPGTRT